MPEEKRRFSRICFKMRAELIADGISHSVKEINDIGIGGCRLFVAEEFKLGTVCQVRLFLNGTNNELNILVEGEIIRSVPGHVVVKFTRITPDSLFHLQNVIRYNSPDGEKIEQEIHNHPGLV